MSLCEVPGGSQCQDTSALPQAWYDLAESGILTVHIVIQVIHWCQKGLRKSQEEKWEVSRRSCLVHDKVWSEGSVPREKKGSQWTGEFC